MIKGKSIPLRSPQRRRRGGRQAGGGKTTWDPPRESSVINISNYELSSDLCNLLSRGLSFVLSKKANSFTTTAELFKFLEALDSRHHSISQPERVTAAKKGFKPKSTFTP